MLTYVKEYDYSELPGLQLVGRGPSEIDAHRDVSSLTDREAMGQPERYVPGDMEDMTMAFGRLSKMSVPELLLIAESRDAVFGDRFAAGQLLALYGDPRINSLHPVMVDIPAWSGLLGLNPAHIDEVVEAFEKYGVKRPWIEKESPEYFAAISAFRMGKYPVTNQEYLAFLVDTGCGEIPSSWAFRQYPVHFANHPVYSLSSEACLQYASWLSLKTGRKFRLPTEGEWEYAAGGGRNEYPWGDVFVKDHANTLETGIFQSTPVGIFPKGNSPFGCADMAGNVEEYVADYYTGYQGQDAVRDDLVDINGRYRVARGGSFTRYRDLARCKRRHGPNPKAIYAMGFRLAQDV